jgi:hypothetical protein
MLENPSAYKGAYVSFTVDWSGDVYIHGEPSVVRKALFPKQKKFIRVRLVVNQPLGEVKEPKDISFGQVYAKIIGEIEYLESNNMPVNETYNPLLKMPNLELQYYEPIDDAKRPKYSGYYKVGSEIAPGYWVSSAEMTVGGCYWERINTSGNIIQNHFGVAGITVYVAPTDAVVQFDGCGTMYYIGN